MQTEALAGMTETEALGVFVAAIANMRADAI